MELYYTEYLIAIAPLLPLVLRIGIPLRLMQEFCGGTYSEVLPAKPRVPMVSDQTISGWYLDLVVKCLRYINYLKFLKLKVNLWYCLSR